MPPHNSAARGGPPPPAPPRPPLATPLDISYRGTITDFRRAAATLTGKRSPALSEIMAQFMGHSRRVHDRHYRIQYGINGLLGAYKQLEYLQINPILNDSLPNIIDENSSYTLSDFLDTCNSDPNELEMGLTNLTNAHKDADHNTRDDVEICSSTMQSLDCLSNDSVLSDLTGSNTRLILTTAMTVFFKIFLP